MANLKDEIAGAGERGALTSTGPSSKRVLVVGGLAVLTIVVVLLVGARAFLFPVFEANSDAARQVATANAQISGARTAEALTPTPVATPVAAAVVQATRVTLPTPTVAALPVAQPTLSTASAATIVSTSTIRGTATAAPLVTVSAQQAAELAAAYQRYFDVTRDALRNLDASRLNEVAAGQALAGLLRDIEEDRLQGRALETNVEHDFYVVNVQGDQADVADRYKDSSIYVDPTTGTPLPGQVAPSSPETAPVVSVIYHFQRIDGTWKVVSGRRFEPQGSP